MPYLGKTPSQATRQRYYKTASGGETSISGTMTTGGTLTFNDGEFVDVSVNGVALVAGTDYNTTTANTIGGLSALSANDQVEIVVYDTFSVFGGNVDADFNINNGNLSVSGTSTLTGAVTASGGATLSSSSSGEFNALTISQADNTSGNESRIRFKRTTDAGSDREVAAIVADRIGGNDTDLAFETNTDGADGAVEKMRLSHLGILSVDNIFGLSDTDTGIALGANGADIMQFYTGNSERVRIQAAGGISFNGDSAAANALDDYEEGTFTPDIRIGGSASGISHSSQTGAYTKIGRMVTLTGRAALSSKGSNSGAVTIGGMPFASQNTSNLEYIGSVQFDNLPGGTTDNLTTLTNNNVICRVSPNVLTVEMRRTLIGANDLTNVQMSDTAVIVFTITYFT